MRSVLPGRMLLFGLLVYLAILVLTFPASHGYAYLQSREGSAGNITLAGVQGSIWSGQADAALIDGQHLESLTWRLQPWALLRGQVGLAWSLGLPEIQGEPGFAQGTTRFGLDGGMVFEELEGRIPAMTVAAMADAQALRPSGTVNLSLQDIQWDGQSLVSARGRVVWNDAGVTVLRPIPLGGLVLTLETRDAEVRGLLGDAGGPLVAEGLLILKHDGRYSFNAAFGVRQGAAGAAELRAALNNLGRPGGDGKYRLVQSGHLADLGLAVTPAR